MTSEKPVYKLYYTNFRARAENARQLFALAGVEYEDYRFTLEKWFAEIKQTTPFGQIPVLEVDGEQLAQSNAISRYLAKKFGFAGKDDWECAQIDSFADLFTEYADKIRDYVRVASGVFPGEKETLFKELAIPARDHFLPIVTRYLKENKSGFLIGDKVSWVDLLVAENMYAMDTLVKGYADEYPEVIAHKKKIHSIPAIKEWLEMRPKAIF